MLGLNLASWYNKITDPPMTDYIIVCAPAIAAVMRGKGCSSGI